MKKILLFFLLLSCIPKPSFYIRNLKISPNEKIAIFPFSNLTDSPEAGEKLSNLLTIEVLRTGRIKVLDPGVVEAFLFKERIRLLDRLPTEILSKIREELDVRYVLVGTVLEFRSTRSGKYEIPYISLSVRMINTETGEIVFAASHSLSGRDTETIFGIGRITSIEKLSKIVAEEIASALAKHIQTGS